MVKVSLPPATASWQKSSATGDPEEHCVQVAHIQGHVWVRDSKDPLGPALGFTREGWAVFIVGVQRDEFARSGMPV